MGNHNQHPLDAIARVCHEVNRAYCESMGDHSQPTWDHAPAWQRESARMGVDLHLSGNFGPEASHIAWMQQKLEDGWIYGPVKDSEKKEHPCMVHFNELPPAQQAKDFIFRAVVHALKGSTLDATAKVNEAGTAPDSIDHQQVQMRVHLLDMAIRQPHLRPHHSDIVNAAKAYEQYVLDKEPHHG